MIKVVFHNVRATAGQTAGPSAEMRLPAPPREGEWVNLPGGLEDGQKVKTVVWRLGDVTVDPRTQTALGAYVDVYLAVDLG